MSARCYSDGSIRSGTPIDATGSTNELARLDRQSLKDGEKETMTIPKLCLGLAASIVVMTTSTAAEPAVGVPDAVIALKGCWRGVGEAVGKQVIVALNAKPTLQDAMFVVDVESSAVADPKDRYSAHLIFGAARLSADQHGDDIMGFWADSFGGAYTALGSGSSRPDGFDITYRYLDDAYLNRWTLSGDRLAWSIVAHHRNGVEKPFAGYTLTRVACAPAPG
jgi:hypothetical protein